MKNWKFLNLGFFLTLSAFFIPGFVFADDPIVTNFTASPSSIGSGYGVTLSWNIPTGGYGQNFYFSCPDSVKIKNLDGTNVTCNTNLAIGPVSSSGTAAFFITNVSGTTQTVGVKITPKSYSGADWSAGSAQVYISVGTTPIPIQSFTLSTTTTVASGGNITLSWATIDVTGVNLQFNCIDDLKIISSNPVGAGFLPCGLPAYDGVLPANSSVTINISNNSFFPTKLPVKILPAISTNTYDSTHGLSLEIEVDGKKVMLPEIKSFSSSKTVVTSDEKISFSWDSQNANGVNFRIQCRSDLTAVGILQGTTTTALPCGSPAFSEVLPSMGSTTIYFSNKSSNWQGVLVTLLPRNTDGTYDGTRAKEIYLNVTSPTSGTIYTPPISNLTPVINNFSNPSLDQKIKVVRTITFSTYLMASSRNAQVTALQKMLSLDPTLYPEQLVTGYFGPMTLRAVKKFQERYDIAKNGDDGYGFVGPKTRAKLNSLENF
ncbi:MAG: peptidoglycan-binding domain-containing protein [Candidatus Paceibacterota bacterium]|jgi:hypothetical protein